MLRIVNGFVSQKCANFFVRLKLGNLAMDIYLCLRCLFVTVLYLVVFSHRMAALNQGEDPYEILGVSRSASSGEIKRAYKRLARNW